MTQQQLDYVSNTAVTNTIEEYNTIPSPYIVALYTVNNANQKIRKVKGNNWIISDGSFDKQCLPENDSLSIRVDPIVELKYKNITGITVNFYAEIDNEDAIPKINNISGILFDKEYPMYFDKYITKGDNTFECGLFDGRSTSEIYNAIQAYEFYVKLNFDGNRGNCKISIKNFSIEIHFENKLEVEKDAMYSRLEPYFTDIDIMLEKLRKEISTDDTYIELNDTDQIEINQSTMIGVKAGYTKGGTDYDLVDVDIEWYMSNTKNKNGEWVAYELVATTDTNSDGVAYLAYTPKTLNNFSLQCVYRGTEYVYPATLQTEMKVIKYTPDLGASLNKYTYNITPTSNNTYVYDNIVVTCETDIDSSYPQNVTLQLIKTVNNVDQVIYTYTKNNVSGTFNFITTNYNENLNKIKVYSSSGEYNNYTEKVFVKGTDFNVVKGQNQQTTVTTSMGAMTGNNMYGDTFSFRINNAYGGTCSVTVGSKSFNLNPTSTNGNVYSFKLDSSHGFSDNRDGSDKSYSIKIVYNGITVGNKVYKSMTYNGTTTLHAYKTSTRFMSNYKGYPENTDDGSYRKWSTFNSGSTHMNICGGTSDSSAIASSSGTHKKPRRLQAYNNNFSSNLTIKEFTFSYEEANYPKNDSLGSQNSCNITKPKDWLAVNVGGTTYKAGNESSISRTDGSHNSFSKRSFTKSGTWNVAQINALKATITYNANNNGNVGRLKVRNMKLMIKYRVNQSTI